MADKIRKFFKNLKSDSNFKKAGPGHRLSESTISSHSSRSVKEVPMVKRSELSEASKVAADAALARLQQTANNPTFNTSLGAIQAKVKRELENEKASMSKSTSEPQCKEKKDSVEIPKNYATSGVFFKCPLISNAVLTKEEWKENIKSFLYEQLEYERGLTACLIIQSCNSNREKINLCVETLCKYLENIVTYPEEEKYQKIRMSNRIFCDRVQPVEGSMELLLAAGFEQKKLPNPTGGDEDYLVFNQDELPNVEGLTILIDALRSAEPIQLELDRNIEVLLPSQATGKVELPDSFYSLSRDELRRQQLLRQEAIEKSQMLRTKAMREKEELREMKKYKYALIRVRFPDGILLQGTFSVYERYKDIHEYVQENLQHDLPFALNTPTGHRLLLEEDGDKTLIDLSLVPATVLNFVWQQVVEENIDSQVYLKPEVMMLLQEM